MKQKQAEPVLGIELATLFEHDSSGRLAPADRHGSPAPDFTIARTEDAVPAMPPPRTPPRWR